MKVCFAFLIGLTSVLCITFPKGFEFGASTAAFQIEGSWLADGKSMSVWDNIAHTGLIADNSTADIADDSYKRYAEDISLMKQYGIKNYRMSIAWARILPYGTRKSSVNMKAIEHYRKQFQELLNAGITPYVTLYHNDMPINLVLAGEGYTDPDFVKDFTHYADVCFQHFGDLVKYWFTFNEPWVLSVFDSFEPHEEDTKPYKIAHQFLLSHSSAVELYRTKYKSTQKGKIGWVLNSEMYYPKNIDKPEDVEAAERCLAFVVDWFAEPIFNGDYPAVMKKILGSRLPEFTEEEKQRLKGSIDFFAINHYFSFITEPERKAHSTNDKNNYWADRNAVTTFKPEWKTTGNGWSIVPEGIHDLIAYVHNKWVKNTNLEIYITENGAAMKEEKAADAINDHTRVDYLHRYISEIERAVKEGINVTKYFVWSLLDNFEWGAGLSTRFGIVRVEFGPNPVRIPKASIKWYSELIKSNS